MNLTWTGHYHSGQTAAREDVVVTITPTALRIERTAAPPLTWLYGGLRLTQGFYEGEHVRLERGGDPAEVLVVPDREFLDAVRAVAPDVVRSLADRTRRPHWGRLLGLAGAALATAAAAYLWLIPAAADLAARRVPPAWEVELGQSIADQTLAFRRRCDDPQLRAAVDSLVARLAAAAAPMPYTFRVTVIDDSLVNAFALPGGRLALFRGLLTRTETPEELAGVFAHEMQHVLRHHGTRAIFREIPVRVGLSLIAGNAVGVREAAGVVGSLGVLRYGRSDEEEADREGMRLLAAARIDPGGMVRTYEILQAEEARHGGRVPAYLSTHPSPGARLALMRRLAGTLPSAPPLAFGDWRALRERCRA